MCPYKQRNVSSHIHAHRFKPKQLSKNKALVRQIVDALCLLACEAPENETEAREPNTLSARAMAGQALDALALHVTSVQIYPPVRACSTQVLDWPGLYVYTEVDCTFEDLLLHAL
jgi:hypothetical protein